MDLTSWGDGCRLVSRREGPDAGAQLSLFDAADGFRYTCFITDTAGHDVPSPRAAPSVGHARVEDRVRCWKDCGLANLPFDSFPQAWAQMCLFNGDHARGHGD